MRVLEDETQIANAQALLVSRFAERATRQGRVRLGYKGGSSEADAFYVSDRDLWLAHRKLPERYWNAIGKGDPFSQTTPPIIVEINPPVAGLDRRTSGVFLVADSGEIYLGHRGGVGGGRKRIGKSAFLSWYQPVQTVRDGSEESQVVAIAPLQDEELIEKIDDFAIAVQRFKQETMGGPRPPDSPRTWIFQANPDLYDVRSAVQALEEVTWSVVRHANEISVGDQVFVWEAGRDGGIVALGTIMSKPGVMSEKDAEREFTRTPDRFARETPRVRLRIDQAVVPPLSRNKIREHPELAKLSILQQAQGTNFPVTPEQARELSGLLPSPPSRTRAAPRRLTLDQLASDLYVDESWLQEIIELLDDKRQVIFYGPPGTGKTYVAQQLARYRAGSQSRMRLVQFHPAYSYEDFVEGYRPVVRDGGSGFELRSGPLRRLAEEARTQSDTRFVLIIDEINRGDLPKILGELYFLLEYRDESAQLLYSDEGFALPKNLFFIGTMNTADRSIAMIDAALRRRFHFVPFFPSEAPISGVLSRWLKRHKPELEWLAGVVDLANEQLGSRHGAIGPAHFMRDILSEEWVERIWKHSILPYLEELLFGEDERLESFELGRLRSKLRSAGGGEEPIAEDS